MTNAVIYKMQFNKTVNDYKRFLDKLPAKGRQTIDVCADPEFPSVQSQQPARPSRAVLSRAWDPSVYHAAALAATRP